MVKKVLLGALFLSLLGPQLCLGQAKREPQRRDEMRMRGPEERVRAMKMWKLTDELDLDEAQTAKFFPLMNAFDDKMDSQRVARRALVRNLLNACEDPNPDVKVINDLITKLEKMEEQTLGLQSQLRKDAASILQPDQIGRLVLFQMKFQDAVRQVIREIDEPPPCPPGSPGHPGSPPPPPDDK
jgi:Spy/CpxP family protein refolding chaperone